MPRQLYVYYQVDEPRLAATVAAVRAMHSALVATWPGLQVGLLRRPEARGGLVTLMETYAGAGVANLTDALAAAAAGLPQPRHDEWFEPL